MLLGPHDGGKTSSSALFLDATASAVAIGQAGYLNRFGHPRPDVMARYAERAIAVLRNDADGATPSAARGTRALPISHCTVPAKRYSH